MTTKTKGVTQVGLFENTFLQDSRHFEIHQEKNVKNIQDYKC